AQGGSAWWSSSSPKGWTEPSSIRATRPTRCDRSAETCPDPIRLLPIHGEVARSAGGAARKEQVAAKRRLVEPTLTSPPHPVGRSPRSGGWGDPSPYPRS